MKCPRCHRENTGKNKTCLYCGNPLVADRKPTKKGSRLIAIPVAICAASAVVIIVCSIILMGDKSSKIRDQINLGYRALNEQDYEQAEVCFKKALDLGGDKPSPEAEIGLAETYQNQKKPEEARRYLQQAQKNPTPIPASVVPHYNHVAQQVAIPTITPAPPQTSGGSTGTAVPPTQAPPTQAPPTQAPPDGPTTEPEDPGDTNTGNGSTTGSDDPPVTIAPPGPTDSTGGNGGNPQPETDTGNGNSSTNVGGTDEEAMLLNWYNTNSGGNPGENNGDAGVSVAKAITDLNMDGHPELVISKADNNYQLKSELHVVVSTEEGSEVKLQGEMTSPQNFGSTITDKGYKGTQSCYVDDLGVHILTNVIGEDDGSGNPQVRTTLSTMTFSEEGKVSIDVQESVNAGNNEAIASPLEESGADAGWLNNMAEEISAENSDPEGDISNVTNPISNGVSNVCTGEELLYTSAYKGPGEEDLQYRTNESAEAAAGDSAGQGEDVENGNPEDGTVTEGTVIAPTDETSGENGGDTEDQGEGTGEGESGGDTEDQGEGTGESETGEMTDEQTGNWIEWGNGDVTDSDGTPINENNDQESDTPEEPDESLINPTVETEWETFPPVTPDPSEQQADSTEDSSTDGQPGDYIIDPVTGQPVDPVTGEPVDPIGMQTDSTNTDQTGEWPTGQTNTDQTGEWPTDQTNTDQTGEWPTDQTNTNQTEDGQPDQTSTDQGGNQEDDQTNMDQPGDQANDPGFVIDPTTGQPVDPDTGEPVDPFGGQPMDSTTGNMPADPTDSGNMPQDPSQPADQTDPSQTGSTNDTQAPVDETALLTQQQASFPATFSQASGDAGAANGVITSKIVDIAGSKKLVVVSINSGSMSFDLYAVQNGQVVKTGSGSSQGGFGNASDMYNASQVVFSTGAGIGIASAHTGRADGNMCTVNFWNVDQAGNASPSVNASWNTGSDIGMFQGQVGAAGLNGSWAATLEQDGAPNPLSGGIGGVEPGATDIAVATASGAPGNMMISAMSR
ncbi:MAG: hypothetical protein J6D53_09660 [Blautia sp.]|nr:hypothetical protein [Blautia sp.]